MQPDHSYHPQLLEIKNQLDAASRKAVSVFAGVNPERLKQRPRPDKWSIAECVVHLNLSSQAEIALLNDTYARMPAERETRVEEQFKMDLLGRFLKWTLEPPPMSVFKLKTTKNFQPVGVEPVSEVLPTFLALQEQLKSSVDEANGLPLSRIRVVSTFNSKVKYNLFSSLNLLLAHERRHLWQAEKAKQVVNR